MGQDSFSQFEPSKNQAYYSVSEITKMIQNCLESAFSFVQVKGEISNFTAHTSGHWYFTLKDNHSQIRVAMFRNTNQKMTWKPQRGESLEVKIQGQISVYKTRGEYQIICQKMEKCGKGALQEKFERLKEKLQTEGLFDRKKPLPFLPKHITIISSPTGAAIQDVLNILKRRYRGVKVTLIPAIVQGNKAPNSLICALEQAKQISSADVLILTRGGGSLEDLWAFNNETLARHLFQFPLPVICAVGHEVDFTICDFIADLRAPTPSAAAELVVQNVADLNKQIQKIKSHLCQNIQREMEYLKEKISHLHHRFISPLKKIQDFQQYLDEINITLKREINRQNDLRKRKVMSLSALLDSLSPLKILTRGYCIVSKDKNVIKTAKDLKENEELHIRFLETFVLARVSKTGALKKEN